MHEVPSELKALNNYIDYLSQHAASLEYTTQEGLRDENRQNTDRFIGAFSGSMLPLTGRVLVHEQRLKNFANLSA